ncbi:amidohydrolase family protein [Arthrospiribacter ruber]|uniref:Amidohydrolase n=1 Tax=Arthrospiribacter ruber TaxID=2487934 RepID=A0A951MBE1_9BACT|nr:amidohydrolase family protein [Arthrospiribacter ruber]MBW3466737.1 amidohydrolase [Arthrospiribacter ruber]
MNLLSKFRMQLGVTVLLVSLHFSTTIAQSDPTGERRVTGTYAIKNATITTSPGTTVTNATILIKDGLIQAVGSNVPIPKEAQVINADSLYIYPGFIDGASTAGVSKPAEVDRPSDFNPSNPPDEVAGITPWRTVLDYYDGKNSQVADWRKVGFTIAQVVPEGGMLPGKAAVVVLGSASSTNVIAQNTALMAKFRGMGRGMYPGTQLGVMAKFRDLYKNASYSAEHGRLFASTAGLQRPEINKTYEAFYAVLDKNIPVLFEVSNDLEIRRALKLQKENGFNIVLAGVNEVDAVIEDIKAANAKVLLSFKLPDDKVTKSKVEDKSEEIQNRTKRVIEAYELALKQAALLEEANIPFAFGSMGARSADLHKNLKIMVENGLSEKTALAALTTNAANILGIQKFAGTLEKGKLANMVIMTDPIFSESAQIKHVVADGYIFDYDVSKKKSNGNEEASVEIEGSWEYVSDTPAGSSGGTMDIKKEGDGYKGTITYDNPAGGGKASSEMKDINISGNYMTFSFGVSAGGMSLDVTVSGDIQGDEFSGNMSLADFGSFPLNATKTPKQR